MNPSSTIVALALIALAAYALHLDRAFELEARAGIYELFIRLKNRKK